VASTATVCLIDVDSFQVRDPVTGRVYRCPVGRPEFTAPELIGKRYADVDGTVAHDSFALEVLIWRILEEGFHPFDARYLRPGHSAPGIGRRIAAGHFPHAGLRIPWEPPRYAPPFTILDPVIQVLMLRCFRDGHTNPDARPTTQEWIAALHHAEQSLICCNHNSQHWYGSHLKTCPWCERKRLLGGIDPFPAKGSLPTRPQKQYPRRLQQQPRTLPSLRFVRPTIPGTKAHRVIAWRSPILVPALNSSRPPVWFIILLILIGVILLGAVTSQCVTNSLRTREKSAATKATAVNVGPRPTVFSNVIQGGHETRSATPLKGWRLYCSSKCTEQKARFV
jgi:hypothetical protein